MRAGETKPAVPGLHRPANRTSSLGMVGRPAGASWRRWFGCLLVLALPATTAALEPADRVDLGDGTIAHVVSGLQWEKKIAADGAADPAQAHDADNRYTAEEAAAWLAALNDGTFAGHADWRLPTQAELTAAMPADAHPLRSKHTSMFHQWPCRSGCADLTAATCSCVAVTSDSYYRSATVGEGDTVVALGYLTEKPGLEVRNAAGSEALPLRAVRTLTAADLAAAKAVIAARPTPLPNEIYAGVAAPRTQQEVLLCKQGCSNRFLKNNRGDELVRCLERCNGEAPPP